MKEKIKKYINKEKILKVIHAIGYIAIAILVLIFTIVGVQSCNATNEQTTNKPINKVVETQQDYLYQQDYLLANEGVVAEGLNYVYSYTRQEGVYNRVDYKAFFDKLLYLTKDYDSDNTSNLFYCSIALIDNNNNETSYFSGPISFVDYDDSAKTYFLYSYGERVKNVSYILLPDLHPNIIKLESYLTLHYDLPIYNGFLENISLYNGSWQRFEYYIKPYLALNKDLESFYINLGFEFNGAQYFGIEYIFHRQLIFHGSVDLVFEPKVSKDGELYYFHLTKDLSFQQTLLRVVTFGLNGYYFLEDNYIHYDGYLSDEYYLHEPSLMVWALSEPTGETAVALAQDLNFMYNNNHYNGINSSLYESEGEHGNNLHVEIAFGQNGSWEQIINVDYYGSPTGIETWNTRNTDHKIIFEGVYYDEITYTFINQFLTPDKGIKSTSVTSGGVILGDGTSNIFSLIGSAFSGLTSIFAIAILPGLTIGTMLFIPLVLGIILFIIHLFKR